MLSNFSKKLKGMFGSYFFIILIKKKENIFGNHKTENKTIFFKKKNIF